MTMHFFGLAALGEGLSGGDRIFIEFARRWSKNHLIHIYLWREGFSITRAQNLSHPRIRFHIVNMGFWPKLGFFINYLARITAGIRLGLILQPGLNDYIYSCSDFWMDVAPALILKWRFPALTWFAGWYQTAPLPTSRTSSPFYWLSQLVAKPLLTRFADFILVNNTEELNQFTSRPQGSLVVVLGAINLQAIVRYQKSRAVSVKKYVAVFQGRFHPQKGALELIDIWKLVTQKLPDAKLAMIGDGELMPAIQKKVKKLGLDDNIKLFGYVYDGDQKYKIFSQSQIVVHPALYDSGGMAAAEAMAFGLPAVGFNLPAYESYYPQGMLKVPPGDLTAFSTAIVRLITDTGLRRSLGQQARSWVNKSCSWDTRAKDILTNISSS